MTTSSSPYPDNVNTFLIFYVKTLFRNRRFLTIVVGQIYVFTGGILVPGDEYSTRE